MATHSELDCFSGRSQSNTINTRECSHDIQAGT